MDTRNPKVPSIMDRETASRQLLGHRDADGRITAVHPYQKWQGPFWTLVALAEAGHPAGDMTLTPLREQFHEWLFCDRHLKPPRSLLIPGQEDRFRRCACQEGGMAWACMKLGIADHRTEELIERLLKWQWPDGGWNCDKRPSVRISSFHETIVPMRALSLHATLTGSASSRKAARRAAELFLSRRLFRRRSDGEVMEPDFLCFAFPRFWSYDILFGLQVMAETGLLHDPRCAEALDLLRSKRLPDGGWPLDRKVWKHTDSFETRGSFVDWGPCCRKRSNPWVTAQALAVLGEEGGS